MSENHEKVEKAELKLTPSVRQEPVLAPMLREGLRVLQMDWATLASEIRHEAETNPVVELEEPDAPPVISDEMKSETLRDEDEGEAQGEYESYPSVSPDEVLAERHQRFFDRQVAVESLQEHLRAQIGPAGFSEADGTMAELIIGDIDDDGRYVGLLADLADVTGVKLAHVEDVLRRVQEFDPPGVAGRNLRECLMIQARQAETTPEMHALLERIIAKNLASVARHQPKCLANVLHVTERECRAALRILRSFEPKPGRPFLPNGRHPQYIRPEVEIESSDSGFTLAACERDLPTLKISPYYRDMADDDTTPSETRQYLRDRIGEAEQLQEAIRRRGETVLKVAETVFSAQYDFFAHGFEALHPLTIEEVAHRTGYHGTTVGRAVRGKYVRTPRGIYELRRFFCVGHLGGGNGDASVSATAVKCRIGEMIRAEGRHALSDEALAKALCASGLTIARRTVAKYRTELGFPAAARRRKLEEERL